MKKYIIRENIPWEGYHQWTVFHYSEDSAKTCIKMFAQNYTGENLSVISEKSAKGRKHGTEGIDKHTSKFEE